MAFEDLTVSELKKTLKVYYYPWELSRNEGKLLHTHTSTPFYSNTMPCSCIMQIDIFLHFVDNEDTSIDYSNKSWKVQNIIDYLCKRFCCVYTPGKN